jgi:hypothetical protein
MSFMSAGVIASMQRVYGPGVGGTHRYWEFYPLAAAGTANQIAEIEMAATVGGANVAGSKTYSSVSVYAPDYSDPGAAFAGDGDTSRTNRTGQLGNTFGCTLRVDFGSLQTIQEFRVQMGTPYSTNPLLAFVARGSDDLSSWTSYGVFTNITWTSASQMQSFPLTAAMPTSGRSNARGWRLWFDANNGGGFCVVSDVIFAATASGAGFNTHPNGNPGSLSSGGNAIGSRTTATYAANNYEKGMAGSASPAAQYWGTNFTSGHFVGFVTAATQDCVEARIISFGASSQVNAPKDGKIEYTTDFVTWTAIDSWTGITTGWNTGVTRSF